MGILCIFCTEISREWLFTKTSTLWDLQSLVSLPGPRSESFSSSDLLPPALQPLNSTVPCSGQAVVYTCLYSVLYFLWPWYPSIPLCLGGIFQKLSSFQLKCHPFWGWTLTLLDVITSSLPQKFERNSVVALGNSVLSFVYAHKTDFLDNPTKTCSVPKPQHCAPAQLFPWSC